MSHIVEGSQSLEGKSDGGLKDIFRKGETEELIHTTLREIVEFVTIVAFSPTFTHLHDFFISF